MCKDRLAVIIDVWIEVFVYIGIYIRDGPKGFFWPKPKTEIEKKIVAETENGRNRNTFGGRNRNT